jgi:hypothetical protein
MKDVYTLFQEASPSLIFVNFMFIGFEVVFSTISYVKEKSKLHSYVTMMIKVPRMCLHLSWHPNCVNELKTSQQFI